MRTSAVFDALISALSPDRPVLIAGPTASGKSALALKIAQQQGGVIVNADASQVYDCWRVISARPTPSEEALAPHALYGHVSETQEYSTGHWLREVAALLDKPERPIIVGGTGLYFAALTEGLAEIPPTPAEVRRQADAMSLPDLIAGTDAATLDSIDRLNRARVQRAWEVRAATGRGLADWQRDTPDPVLSLSECQPVKLSVDRDWLAARIERRFDLMIEQGALEEVAAIRDRYDPTLPAHRAIGVPELMGYLQGDLTLDEARRKAVIATRRYAKRQRTWMRSRMTDWHDVIMPSV